MPLLPDGTIIFLFADIQGSSRLWEQSPETMRLSIVRHEALSAEIIRRYGGVLVRHRGEGDGLFAVFTVAPDAVAAALELQRAYRTEPWATPMPLKARMALHVGEAELRDNDYFGNTVNRCARLRAIGHGGQTLLSEALSDLVRERLPEAASLRDLGFQRLKDLQRSERVYQLVHPDLEDTFPPLRSLNDLHHNLPLQLTSFIGREEEIRQIKGLLSPDRSPGLEASPHRSRLVTLLGAGGAGKTRLALQAAAELIEEFEHGVRLVELAALPAHSELVPQAVAAALGVRETAGKELESLLIEFLEPRSLLLVLDNCEHVAAACAPLAERLLLACPHLMILATSRQTLQCYGETIWRIPPLPVPYPRAALSREHLGRFEGIRLFVERAATVKPGFALSDANAHAIVRICRRLDGLPFGIELAAAKIHLLSVQQIATRLERSFRDLSDGAVTRDERQRSLAALIEWSYRLLSEEDRKLLLRLSVFAGGWTLEAMEAVCGEPNAEQDLFESLARLEKASLVVVEAQAESNRFRLLETVRQYAAEKLTATGEAEALRERHRNHFVRLAEEAEPFLTRKEQADWTPRLAADHDNLRAALAFDVSSEAHLRLAGALRRFWSMQGMISEGLDRLKSALKTAVSESPALRARALNGLGSLALQQNDYETSSAALQKSLELFVQACDRHGEAETLRCQGGLALALGRLAEARMLFERSLALYRAEGDLWGAGANLNNLGIVARAVGDSVAVKALYEESLTLYRALGDATRVASVASNLGIIALDEQDYALARTLFEESLPTFQQLNDAVGIATTLHNLGVAILKLEGHEKAFPFFHDSLLRKQEMGNRASIALTLFSMAEIARDAAEFEHAAILFACAEATWAAAGMVLSEKDRRLCEEAVAPLHQHLDPPTFQQLWIRGTQTSLDQAVEMAVEDRLTKSRALC